MDDLRADAEPALTPAGLRVLDAATELFYRRGIHAVGVELIAERAGVTKKTLYDRFGSKDALVAQYLRRRGGRWQRFLLDRLDQRPHGADRALAVFDAAAEWHARSQRGCAFVNAYAELGFDGYRPLRVATSYQHTSWRSRASRDVVRYAPSRSVGPSSCRTVRRAVPRVAARNGSFRPALLF
jgi:AcrR family transcriptional regulator